MDRLPEGYRALVIGASGAIGAALVRQLRQDPRCAQVRELCRRSLPGIDFDNEVSVSEAAGQLKQAGPFQCIINAAGILHGLHGMPERRLSELNYARLQTVFRVNTFGPALVLAHFVPLLSRREPCIFATISARVGSIGDNRLGGWYSYRASKAALNMLVKTASIEVARTHPQAVLCVMHPGTVKSSLSAPFNGEQRGRPADLAAVDMLKVLDGLTTKDSGGFFAYDGLRLPR
jgi:NAD(P)-dependent dehydrogenase (short-subunit alcohol dehydrogenase family)